MDDHISFHLKMKDMESQLPDGWTVELRSGAAAYPNVNIIGPNGGQIVAQRLKDPNRVRFAGMRPVSDDGKAGPLMIVTMRLDQKAATIASHLNHWFIPVYVKRVARLTEMERGPAPAITRE